MKIEKSLDELVLEAQRGNKDSERLFLEILRERFAVIVKLKLQSRARDGDDVVQEALITVSQKYLNEKFDNFWSWAFVILRKKLGNFFKKKRLVALPEDGSPLPPILIEQNEESYTDFLYDLERAIRTLAEECRRIFRILLGGGSREEILEQFPGLTPNAVDVKIHRCRKLLKTKLHEWRV